MNSNFLKTIPWSYFEGLGFFGLLGIVAIGILLWKSPNILATILTHIRESRRINEDIALKKKRLDLEIRAKMAKINNGSKTGSRT